MKTSPSIDDRIPAGSAQAISLSDFRFQYVDRVLKLLGRDVNRAAQTLGVPDQELKSFVGQAD